MGYVVRSGMDVGFRWMIECSHPLARVCNYYTDAMPQLTCGVCLYYVILPHSWRVMFGDRVVYSEEDR